MRRFVCKTRARTGECCSCLDEEKSTFENGKRTVESQGSTCKVFEIWQCPAPLRLCQQAMDIPRTLENTSTICLFRNCKLLLAILWESFPSKPIFRSVGATGTLAGAFGGLADRFMATGDALSHGCKGMMCKRPTKVLCYRYIYI